MILIGSPQDPATEQWDSSNQHSRTTACWGHLVGGDELEEKRSQGQGGEERGRAGAEGGGAPQHRAVAAALAPLWAASAAALPGGGLRLAPCRSHSCKPTRCGGKTNNLTSVPLQDVGVLAV